MNIYNMITHYYTTSNFLKIYKHSFSHVFTFPNHFDNSALPITKEYLHEISGRQNNTVYPFVSLCMCFTPT